MITQEERKFKTPSGGDRAVVYYQGPDGEPADKEEAVGCEMIEYKGEEEIGRMYMEISPE